MMYGFLHPIVHADSTDVVIHRTHMRSSCVFMILVFIC